MKLVSKAKKQCVIVEAPPSKAHTLRALILSSLAEGESKIYHPLLGEDQWHVIHSLKALGVKIEVTDKVITIQGTGGRYTPISEELNVGESGVGMNFLISAVAFSDKPLILTGAEGLIKRPIKEVVDGLLQLGVKIEYLDQAGYPPVKVYPLGMQGGEAKIFGAKTSQYFSSITIAAPYAKSDVLLKCMDDMNEKPYYDITLDMMRQYGVKAENRSYKEIDIKKGQRYKAQEIQIEGDFSSASFFFLAAAVCKINVTVHRLSLDSVQGDKAFVDLMERMGCKVTHQQDSICIEGQALKSIEVDMGNIPDLVPPMAIAAAFANGVSRFTNIGHLRHKECDRLAVVVEELQKMGAKASYDEDSMTICGCQNLHGTIINPHNDHRIAMSFAVAGLVTGNQQIEDETCVAKSFPDFWERFEAFYA